MNIKEVKREVIEIINSVFVSDEAIQNTCTKHISDPQQVEALAKMIRSEHIFKLVMFTHIKDKKTKECMKTLYPQTNNLMFDDLTELLYCHIRSEYKAFSGLQNPAVQFICMEISSFYGIPNCDRTRRDIIYPDVVRWLYRCMDNEDEIADNLALIRLVFETAYIFDSNILGLKKFHHFVEKHGTQVKILLR